ANTENSLYWNAWADAQNEFADQEPHYKTLSRLENEQHYTVYVDLAPIAYAFKGIISAVASGDIGKLRLLAAKRDHVDLQLVILRDPRFFLLNEAPEQKFRVTLTSLKPQAPASQPGLTLEENAKLRLGRASIPITTLNAQGLGTIDVSVWANNQ